jgi:uncharacterized protein
MTRRIQKRSRTCLPAILLAIFGLTPAVGLLAPAAASAASVEKLQEFPLDQVQITDEYQTNLFNKDVAYLITKLDSDRLLAGFKAMSQNVTPSNLYGGWENSDIRGHTGGHWMSAVARAYQQAKGSDPTLAAQIKTKLDDVVSKLKTYQQSDGYLFATPVSQFDNDDAGTGSSWVPYYTMHKILAGIIDIYNCEGNADALAIASKLGDWIFKRTQGWSAAARGRIQGQEYGGMNDALYELYKLTKNANHLAAAQVFDDTNLFKSFAANKDVLGDSVHANMTIPKFIGALNRYRTVGTTESTYLDAASGFFDIVVKDHSYVTGGNSENEHFHAAGTLNKFRDNINNETCNAYNMTKLTRDLFRVTGDVKYANFYERIHINEILSSMNPDTGMTTYFKAMGTGYFKVFGTETGDFWCCTGTGMENFTRLGDSVYFHDDKDLWVTFYVSSKLDWKDRGLALTQTTDLPASNKVTITITAAPTDAVSLKFRKPDWTSTCAMAVSVNGEAVTATESAGFVSVSRVWQANDKVELAFPLLVQTSRLSDAPNTVAFTYGPLVLSASLGIDNGMTTSGIGVGVRKAEKPTSLQDTIKISSGAINDWLANVQANLVQTPGKLEFNLKGTDSDGKLVFIPHYSRYKDRYGIYWNVSGTAGGTATTNLVCPTVSTGGSSDGGAGGHTGSGGAAGDAGAGSGGSINAGGATAGVGGAAAGASGGGQSSGGKSGNGGVAAGGGQSAGGASSAGGNASGSGGHLAGASGGNGGSGGSSAGGTGGTATDQNSGCSCSLGNRGSTGGWMWMIGLVLGIGLITRRRGRRI